MPDPTTHGDSDSDGDGWSSDSPYNMFYRDGNISPPPLSPDADTISMVLACHPSQIQPQQIPPPPLSPGDTTTRPLVLHPPSSTSQPVTQQSISTQEKEHWSVRMKEGPLPCGPTLEDLARPTPTHPAVPLSFRRSQRLFQKSKPKPEDCVLYPPYYGRPSPEEELEIAIEQRKAQLKKRKIPTSSSSKPKLSPLPPAIHLTEEEKKEFFASLAEPPNYATSYKASSLHCDDSFVPTCPLLTEINEATLAIVGWRRKNG